MIPLIAIIHAKLGNISEFFSAKLIKNHILKKSSEKNANFRRKIKKV